MGRDLTELDALEKYLKEKGIDYEREDKDDIGFCFDFHKISVLSSGGGYQWDAICHKGSYGCEEGLLEIRGSIVDEEKDGDSVAGWLTAQDVIDRIEAKAKDGGRK